MAQKYNLSLNCRSQKIYYSERLFVMLLKISNEKNICKKTNVLDNETIVGYLIIC